MLIQPKCLVMTRHITPSSFLKPAALQLRQVGFLFSSRLTFWTVAARASSFLGLSNQRENVGGQKIA